MRLFTHLIDVIALRSEKPFRRLLAYYLFLGAVVFIVYRLLPVGSELLQAGGIVPPDGAANVLQDGLVGAEPVPVSEAASAFETILSTVAVMLLTLALMLPVSWVFMSARRAARAREDVD